jgi:hypothetical protein
MPVFYLSLTRFPAVGGFISHGFIHVLSSYRLFVFKVKTVPVIIGEIL